MGSSLSLSLLHFLQAWAAKNVNKTIQISERDRIQGGYKPSDKSAHRQPEKHPHWAHRRVPRNVSTSAAIHRSSDYGPAYHVWIGSSICMVRINDGAATLRHEWRSLPEEGPPHVNFGHSAM